MDQLIGSKNGTVNVNFYVFCRVCLNIYFLWTMLLHDLYSSIIIYIFWCKSFLLTFESKLIISFMLFRVWIFKIKFPYVTFNDLWGQICSLHKVTIHREVNQICSQMNMLGIFHWFFVGLRIILIWTLCPKIIWAKPF